ncbi:MAG: type II toxin-antitoxin system RelE/ParE family toxin [Candidatus Pacebacteria bacterium]|nr:type II toxin-antitoxin system RelE/ParE family toxin [Candidatus Paceibacterota bacterium]
MEVQWTKPAEQDLRFIHSYIDRDNKIAARKVVARIYNAVHTQLLTAPRSGRTGRVKNTRELVLTDVPYIVAYQIQGENVIILRVLHTLVRWPEEL